VPAPDLLKHRVILVTGAGGGVGRAAALTFARYGATVILHGRDVSKLESVYDAIEAQRSPQPTILPLDFSAARDRDFENMALAIESQLGRLDGIVHNAAHFDHLGPLDQQRLDAWLLSLRVNLAVPFALTRACTHLLKAAKDASVVLSAESHALRPAAYWAPLAVAQSALVSYAQIQAQEWELQPQLRINVLVPGAVDSPQRRRTHPGERREARAAPEQLMPVYVYLMGPDSRGVSGRVFQAQD